MTGWLVETRNLVGAPHDSVPAASFDEWGPGEHWFDPVVAVSSWHWVEADTGKAKAVEVLTPHGHLVVVTTPVVVPAAASEVSWDVRGDWAAVGAERVDPGDEASRAC